MANDDDEKRSERDENESPEADSETSGESDTDEAEETDDEAASTEASSGSVGSEGSTSAGDASEDSPKEPAGAGASAGPKRMSAGARLAAAKAAKAVAKAQKKEERKAAAAGEAPKQAEAVEASDEPLAQLEESELGRAALRAGRWWESNQQLAWVALAAAALAIVGFLGFRYHSETQSQAAGALLADAVEIAGAAIVAEDAASDESDDEGEEEGDEERTFATLEARDEAALEAYRAVVTQFPTHPSASIARLGVARALLSLGRHEEALAAYEEAFDRHGQSSHIAWQALEGMGFAQEGAGQTAEAQATYERLLNLEDHAFESVARYHLARLMLARGEEDEARTALRELVDTLRADTVEDSTEPRFPYVLAQAEVRLRELDPSSATSTGPSLLQQGGGEGGEAGEGGDISPEQLQELIRQFQARQGGAGGAGGGEGGGE